MTNYSYSVLQYTDDCSRGEHLNCGVLVWLPSEGRALIRFGQDDIRLGRAFSGFSAHDHTEFELALFSAVYRFNDKYSQSRCQLLSEAYQTAEAVCKYLISDQQMAYRFHQVGGGTSEKSIEEISTDLLKRYCYGEVTQ